MDIIIIGAGGFGKEVAFLINRMGDYTLKGFVDDNYESLSEKILGLPLLGNLEKLKKYEEPIAVAIGIANPHIKEKIFLELSKIDNISFPNLVDKTALIGINIKLGIGNIFMPYTTFTGDISIGNFNMFNMSCTIGHDSSINDYNDFFPSVNVSGNAHIGSHNQFGVGTKIIPAIQIGNSNIIGAGTVLIETVKSNSKIVGVPGKKIGSV